MNLTNPQEIKRIMNSGGFRFNKLLGQNFLIDDAVIQAAVDASGISENHAVIEVGPGIGALTAQLANNAGKVVAIELDRGIADYLKSAFVAYNNVEIIQGDALKINLKQVCEDLGEMKICVVANLPYYITTPLIMKFLEDRLPLESITVMVQKEVAERMAAAAGTKEFGALSLAVQYRATPEMVMLVPPEAFMPAPKVTSAIIKLDIKNHIKPPVSDEKLLFTLIKAAFGQRRKTLVNALSAVLDVPKALLRDIVTDVCGSENVRGEVLGLEQFIRICDALK